MEFQMRSNHIVRRKQSSRTTAAVIEALESRRLLSITYSIVPDPQLGGTTLKVTSDDNVNDLKFQTNDQVNLLLVERDNAAQREEIVYPIPMASFDRIAVRMGG